MFRRQVVILKESSSVLSAKETTDRTYLRYCPNQGVWIRLHYFEGMTEWRWLCSVTFTDCSW
jgi:hypothetical protein